MPDDLPLPGCAECGARLRYLPLDPGPVFACDGCGGMFDAGPMLGDIARAIADAEHELEIRIAGFAPPAGDLAATAAAHGLSYGSLTFRPIAAATAHRTLEILLFKEMAYSYPVRQREEAAALAARVVGAAHACGLRFFTNRPYNPETDDLASGWIPATPSTFDAGILAVGELGSLCVWLVAED